MPSNLRFRVGLLALLGAFLIPIGMSSLRGLTHVLTCEESAATPFTLIIPEEGAPQVISSRRITPDDEALCGGLSLLMAAGESGPGAVDMAVSITNNTEVPWKGTVALTLQGTGTFPVDIGAIPPGATESDQLTIRLRPGSHELEGTLLIGP